MKTRFIKSICETAPAKVDVAMPWTRGERRAAFIAKRKTSQIVAKKAA